MLIKNVISILLVAGGLLCAADPKAYRLGPNDEIRIHAVHVSEFPQEPIRIDAEGFVTLPFVGSIKAQDLTTSEFTTLLKNSIHEFVLEPDITVTLAKRRSLPVSVIGAVHTPGVQQLQEPKRLVEILSLAGGVKDDAGTKLKVTRRIENGVLPLATAKTDPSGQYSIAEVDLDELVHAANPADNIFVAPDDVISVPRADIVYVIGEVKRPGGITLHTEEKMRVLQVVAMAEGFTTSAGPKGARIMRVDPKRGERIEMAVNLKKILDGDSPDIAMLPDDILIVPTNVPRNAAKRSAEVALQMITGVVIWRR